MNLRKRKRPTASVNEMVVDPLLDKHLKLWPEKVKRKRTVKLLSKSLDNNAGRCIKKSATRWDEVAKPLDDNDRKMQFSEAMDSAFELQGFSQSSGARLKEINKGSCATKRVRCPNVSTLPNESIIKVVNPSFKKYPKHLQIGGALCVKGHLAKFLNWPESVRKKRSSSGLNQLSDTLENTLGSARLGKCQKGAREKFGTSSAHSLPEEVVEEILSRLPGKSLTRFRCVCKLWHHLSYSERFISLHLKNYRASQLLVGSCWVLGVGCSMDFLPPPPPTGGYSDNDKTSRKTMKYESLGLLGGSCNGIVCLYGHDAIEDIVLWNPATDESKTIQKHGEPGFTNYCTVGFGFDPKTNDYKILKMVYGKLKPPVAQMELYSLRKGSWKMVDSHDFLVVRNASHVDEFCSLPFTNNRIVCTVVSPLNGASKWEILSFDMSSEMYEIIPVSQTLDAELGEYKSFQHRNRYFKLFPFKETIALGIVHRVGNGTFCDIWVLNGFKSTQSRSWSKFLSTNINDGNILPVGCWGSCQVLFQEFKSKRLLRLDHGHNMMVELGVIPRTCATTTVYKESLVRINDLQEDEDSKCW